MHKCKYCGKEFESGSKLGGHIIWCKENPKSEENKIVNRKAPKNMKNSLKFIQYNDKTNICNCQYCKKECKGKNALIQHEIRCKENPNKLKYFIPGFNNSGRTPWNKGLTKETDNRVANYAQTTHNKYESGELKIWCDGLTAETDDRIAKLIQSQKKNGKCGGYRENSGICKHGKYNGIHCDSAWELAYILYCNDNNIPIKRCDKVFDYFDNDGNKHRYYPDFIINDNEIIEIKGRVSEQWKLKLPIVEREHIKVLYGEDMKDILNYCYKKYGYDLTYLYDK